MEWFELEGTLKTISFHPPQLRQGHLLLDQVAQSSILPGLVNLWGGGIHSFSGQPVLMPHLPLSEEFLNLNDLEVKIFLILNLLSFSLYPLLV